MAVEAKIAVLPVGDQTLQFRHARLEPGPFEVVVKQTSFGVCHSQLDRVYSSTPHETALVLGHESVGTVAAVGPDVDYVGVGDPVFTTWIPRSPLDGRAPRPSRVVFPDGSEARTHNTFTWGTHAMLDEQYVVKAPADVPADLGTVIGCALMTGAGSVLNSADVQAGQTVAVWGAGGVGLCAVAAAAIRGAAAIIAIDIDDDKLALARRFGATALVNAKEADPAKAVRDLTAHPDGTRGADVCLDCTGLGANIPVSLAAVRPGIRGSGRRGGVNVLVGIPRVPFELHAMDLINGEKALLGCVGGGCDLERDFATFVGWTRDSRFDPTALVTNRYPLADLNTAVDDLHHGRVLGRAVIELPD
jgi:S-(hydroxymethyl)glutathione dehydrogenase / alcohol dehydrogenase